jgi:hypothetical protein
MKAALAVLSAFLLAAPAAADDPKDKPAAASKEKRFSPNFEEAPLYEVLDWLKREAGFEYNLTKDAQTRSKKGEEAVRVVAKEITAREALDMALAQLDLTWAEKVTGQIRIMTKDEFVKGAVLELYDVRDLLNPITDFAGPEGELRTKKVLRRQITGEWKEHEYPDGHVVVDPPDGEKEKKKAPKPMEDPRSLVELIKKGTGGDEAWGEGTSLDVINGILYVKAPWAMQVKVKGLLNELIQFK